MDGVAQVPDKTVARDTWVEYVKPIARAGKLEKIPTKIARTKKEKDTAREMNRLLSQRSFMLPAGAYDSIDWGR